MAITAKHVILTAIKLRGLDIVKNNAKEYADNCLCTEAHVKSIIRQVESNKIQLK